MTRSYLDFELEIGADDGSGYPLTVLQSPAGNARSRLRLMLSGLELENRLMALEKALLRSGGRRRKLLSADERTVESFGRDLFTALFHDDIRALYFQSRQIADSQEKGLRLKLRIHAPELAVLPWEFLFDDRPAEYVSLSQSTPVVRYLETAHALRPLAVTPPLRILGMMASPPNLAPIDTALEKERLERALAGLQRRGLVQLEWLAGQSWRDLMRAMRQGPWHVFHFLGHGFFDTLREEGVLAVTDDAGQPYALRATELARMLGDHPTLRLALLNACEGGLASRSDIFASTAATMVRRGVPAVIAMQVEITEAAAIEFSSQFYEALAEGLPVDTAVTEARKAVSLAIANTLEWGIPVLMSRAPDGVIFDIHASPEPVESQPAQPRPPEPRPAEAKPQPKPVIDFDWVMIPPGEFFMGSDKQKSKEARDDEAPQHRLYLPAYRISRTPVTVAHFAAFVQATGYKTRAEELGSAWVYTGSKWGEVKGANWAHPRGSQSDVSRKQDHPVTCVVWRDARAFCEWAKVRLPTEAEWEKAARGVDGRRYPWGDAPPTERLCNFNMIVGDTTPVGRYVGGAGPYGCLDMAGNVWEWTNSLWGKDWEKPDYGYPYDPSDGREDSSAPNSVYRIVRGGSWYAGMRWVRCAARLRYYNRASIVGFRVVSSGF